MRERALTHCGTLNNNMVLGCEQKGGRLWQQQ